MRAWEFKVNFFKTSIAGKSSCDGTALTRHNGAQYSTKFKLISRPFQILKKENKKCNMSPPPPSPTVARKTLASVGHLLGLESDGHPPVGRQF